MSESGIESMNDQQRFEVWMASARRLRVIADVAEKVLLLVGCLGVVVGAWMLIDRQYVVGSLAVLGGLAVVVVGSLLGALGQNQASINECNCRVLDQLKRIEANSYRPQP